MPSKNRNYYKKIISEHKKILARARSLIGVMLEKIEEEVKEFENIPQDDEEYIKKKEELKLWWGDKESASGVLAKLTTILLKLIPLELEIARTDLTKADLMELESIAEKTQIPQEDMEIIERYVEKFKQIKQDQS